MTCAKHNVRMIRLVLRGRVRSREHAALLAAVRRCPRCTDPTSAGRPFRPDPPRVPRIRVEQSVRDLEAAVRR